MNAEEPIRLSLSKDHALVLFDWLSRRENDEPISPELAAAVERVHDDILCDLESVLVEPFDRNYESLVQAACQRVAAS